MKKIGFIIFLALDACKTHKVTQSRLNEQQHLAAQQTESAGSLEQHIQTGHLLINHQQEHAQAEIIPVGAFSYRPDSGFRGSAAKIIIRKEKNIRQLEKDSTAQHTQAVKKQQTQQQLMDQTEKQDTHTDSKAQSGSSAFSLILLVLVLAGTAYAAIRFRK